MSNPINNQLFINMQVTSPDKKVMDVPTTGISALWIIEDIDQLVPVCSFIYKETFSEFSELFPLLGNESLSIDLGLNKDRYRTFKFKYFSYESKGTGAVMVKNKDIMATWIDAYFTKLRNYPQVLYYNKSTGSSAASTIAAGIPIEIESSKGTHDIFLHNMVVGEALKHLAKSTYNAEGSSYLFFKNLDKFVFKSRNAVMRGASRFTYIYGYNMTHLSICGNDRSLFTNPEGTVIGYSYRDGQNFEFTKTPNNVKDKKVSFGKQVPFGDGTDISPRFVYDGTRYIHEAEGKAMANTEAYMDSASRMCFTGLGEPFLSCGDIIEIQMGPSLKEYGRYNMMLSGKWLVEKVVHYISSYQYMVKVYIAKGNTDFTRRRAVL